MPRKPPSFFKVMFSDSPDKTMRIPSAFVKKFRKELGVPNTFKLKCGGKSWRVVAEMKKDGCFFVGGWPKFYIERNLEFGDFLVFNLVKKSVFEVDVYGPKSECEKIPNFVNHEDVESEIEEIPIKGNTTKRRKPDVAGEITAKRRKSEEFAGGNTPKRSTAAKRGRNSKKVDPESEFSSVEITMNHRNRRYQVPLPLRFAEETGLKRRKNILIKDPKGEKRPVSINIEKSGHAYLSTGWKDIWNANGLNLGSTILLKFSHGNEDEIELQIPDSAVTRVRNVAKHKGFGSVEVVMKNCDRYSLNLPSKFSQ